MDYKTPGVYVQEISALPPSIAPVTTAVPAFIGYTQFATMKVANDLNMTPTRITSMGDFEMSFGLPVKEDKIKVAITTATDGTRSATATLAEADRSPYMMWYALRMYFDNGGGPCYICSVGNYATPPAAPVITDLENGLAAVRKEDEPTLIVFPEAQYLSVGDFHSLHDLALQQCADLQDRFVIMDTHGGETTPPPAPSLNDPKTVILTAVTAFRNGPSNNLKYGAAYAPNLETNIPFQYDEAKIQVTGSIPVSPSNLSDLQSGSNGDNQAYHMALAAIGNLTCKLPPSGAIAGIYAAVDNAQGVWKAPANVSLTDVIQPTIKISNDDQDQMNVDTTAGKSVNAIRAFTGMGTLVWGARTLAGNDNEWRYVNVRRFCTFAEESIRRATMQFVFEPNDANTWVKVRGMIENFLTTLWKQGALMGAKTSDAFYVAVGLGTTMTAIDILEGRMIVQVGLCPVRPAEFIILQIIQTMPVS